MYEKQIEVRWSDLDPNVHMRHSAYLDFGAHARTDFFHQNGFDVRKFAQLKIGPVLFREEIIYLKEIGMGEKITLRISALSVSQDYRKFGIFQEFVKENGEIAAKLTIEGAWFNIETRKVVVPPEEMQVVMEKMPKHPDFQRF